MTNQREESTKNNACETCSSGECDSKARKPGENDADFEQRQRLQSRLCRIKNKILVLSGKGGVGKSTVAVNLAVSLMLAGKRVGLLDVDIHGPSVPTMLGLENEVLQGHANEILPVELGALQVMSIGFLLNHQDDAVIWRGPRKMGVIKQFLSDVAWGDLDYLVIDSPPGTGDEPLSVVQLLDRVDGAVIVTTPQRIAAVDVRKSISFCRELNVPVLGVVENMSGFVCPHCQTVTQILPAGAAEAMCRDMDVPFLGSLPMDPQLAQCADDGRAFMQVFKDSPVAARFREIITPVLVLKGPDCVV
ncbi:Mrp/NBP35 family ATP-binding protein [Myxococcota bacterium]|nr:Mrp/NBP35 family ATP-binding protein [Myxococcota bacterium]MBU1411316.1 Mrp/NBP35 family ATP-binding protein [Myxococcota bacterium]MBU1509133.1 Mrp/NBP35 family ATP-binding protein [Myxococcota bacterium]